MKIVYVITRSDVMGGASVHLLDLVRGVQEAGHEVYILVGGHGVFQARAKANHLSCISLRHMVRQISPANDWRGYFELKEIVSKIKPDILHLHSSKAGILGRLVAKRLNIPVVFTVHGWSFTEGVSNKRRLVYKLIERFMANFADKIITVSNYDRKLALDLGVGNEKLLTTIHNGIPDSHRKIKRDRSFDHVIKLIMVARFEAPKNHDALLTALARLKHLPWIIEFVGDGPTMRNMTDLARDYGLAERVKFLGARNDVDTLLEKADIFCLISNWEGLPLTILEAMRAGLPVIASRVGGVPEAVQDGKTGILVDRDDEDALAQAITSLVESESLRIQMGQNGRQRFEKEFTFQTMLQKTMQIYDAVVQGNR